MSNPNTARWPLALGLFAVLSCGGGGSSGGPPNPSPCPPEAPIVPPVGFTLYENVSYGLDPNLDCAAANLVIPNSARCLDVFMPDTIRPGAPTVLWVHGGSFVTKDKADQRDRELCVALAEEGVPSVSINYALANCGTGAKAFPEAVQDLKLALAWIRGNVGMAACLPDCVIAAGASAGAVHAALLGTGWDVPHFDPLPAPPASYATYRPNLVVGFSLYGDFQLLGCSGGGVDPSCQNPASSPDCGNCGLPVAVEGCCNPVTTLGPGYAGHSAPVLCFLGSGWVDDCAIYPDSVASLNPLLPNLNTWIDQPENPFVNASPRHWAGFSDVGSMMLGLNDPPFLIVQPRCDTLGQPGQGRRLRDTLLSQGGVAVVLELDQPCQACEHGLATFTAAEAATLILDVWEDPASWFGAIAPPPGGYINCP